MKKSIIFQAAVRVLFPLIILISLFIFWRGHNLPGGGFIGGLVASCGFLIVALSFGSEEARRRAVLSPEAYISLGLFTGASSGFIGFFAKGTQDFMSSVWIEIPLIGPLGTPVMFDLGVYLLVLGFSLHVLLNLYQENAQ